MIYVIPLLIIISIVFYFNSNTYKHNKGRINTDNFSIPKHNNYLFGIYLGYLENIKSGDVLAEIIDNNLFLHIANKDGLKDILISLNDIVTKKFSIKPYHSGSDTIKNHGIDDGASYFAGTPVSNSDEYIIGKSIKISKSYVLTLTLKDNKRIELVFFNDPSILNLTYD